jgi:peptidoglycan/LPS O-acetylase OafA/YrhL
MEASPNIEKISSLIRGYMPVLNGYRGMAILLIFLLHSVSDIAGEKAESVNAVYRNIMNSGWIGVDAFFVLSGFLITGILLDTRNQSNFFINFYGRRIIRIFPPYYVFLILFLGIIYPFIRGYEYENNLDIYQIWYWFYLENWQWIFQGVSDVGPMAHFWSLALEEQFYLVYPALIYFLPRRWLSWFLVTVIVSALLFRSWLLFTHPLTYTLTHTIYIHPFCRVDTLAIGCLIAVWMRSDQMLPGILKISPIFMITSCVNLIIIIIIQGELNPFNPIVESIGFSLIAIFFGSLLILLITQSENSLLVKCLNWPPLKGLGTISYGFYIYHFPILWILNDSIFQYIGHSFILGHLVSMFLCGGLILGISLISWYCLERPILSLKTYFPSNRDDKLSLIETGNLK